jgi:hypothetical protein
MNATFAQQLRAECGVSAQERDFESWLGRVEMLTDDSPGVFSALISDAAIHAFEEGVTTADFALKIQAARL